jgi:hypothetical protein
MQFLRLLDVKRRGSLRFMSVDVNLKGPGVLDIDDVSPVVREMLIALSLPVEEAEALSTIAIDTEIAATTISFQHVVDIVEKRIIGGATYEVSNGSNENSTPPHHLIQPGVKLLA